MHAAWSWDFFPTQSAACMRNLTRCSTHSRLHALNPAVIRPHTDCEMQTNWQLELIRLCSTHSACRLEVFARQKSCRAKLLPGLNPEDWVYENITVSEQGGYRCGCYTRLNEERRKTGNTSWIQKIHNTTREIFLTFFSVLHIGPFFRLIHQFLHFEHIARSNHRFFNLFCII